MSTHICCTRHSKGKAGETESPPRTKINESRSDWASQPLPSPEGRHTPNGDTSGTDASEQGRPRCKEGLCRANSVAELQASWSDTARVLPFPLSGFTSVTIAQTPTSPPSIPSSEGSCNKTAQVSLHLASSRLSLRGKPAHSPCTQNSSSANPYSNYMLSFSTNYCFAPARQLLLPGHVECSPSWQVAC